MVNLQVKGLISQLRISFPAILIVAMFSGLIQHPPPWDFAPGGGLRSAAEAEGFLLIPPAELPEVLALQTRMLLDARTAAAFDVGHLPMAISMPLREFDEVYPQYAPILSPDTPLLVYCGNAACDEALQLARRLREVGHADVAIFLEGYEGWRALQP